MSDIRLLKGDSFKKLKELDENSIDSIVTDPPYMLGFMGKDWDREDSIAGNPDFWKEVYRVLKPGGYLLSFGGSRTYHRMVVAIEDAGFEIRDQIMWLYGSGFPKSHNIGKAVDKLRGNEREVVGDNPNHRGDSQYNNDYTKGLGQDGSLTKGTSEWEGWGTALKPAHEPICMARKPFDSTVVENVIKYGTGGINIDDSRIELDLDKDTSQLRTINRSKKTENDGWGMNKNGGDNPQVVRPEGRFPANVILDEEAGKILDENPGLGDVGGASRFFYCPKASKDDRNEGLGDKNHHPTVKPTDLMKYLIRLVTPPNGTVLDPFMGSGSTGKAAKRLGFGFVGIEREDEYYEIAEKRINTAMEGTDEVVPKETQETLNRFFEV